MVTNSGRKVPRKLQVVVLPVDRLPSGRGWLLLTGNTFLNKWVRP